MLHPLESLATPIWEVGSWTRIAEPITWARGGGPLVGEIIFFAPEDTVILLHPIFGELSVKKDSLRPAEALIVLALVATEGVKVE